MFDLKRPCKTCPFRRGMGSRFALRRARLTEIRRSTAFQCHGTVDYSDEEPQAGGKPQQCAGLMAVLARERDPNQIMQVASRLGHLDLDALDPRREAYGSWAAVLKAHLTGEESDDPIPEGT